MDCHRAKQNISRIVCRSTNITGKAQHCKPTHLQTSPPIVTSSCSHSPRSSIEYGTTNLMASCIFWSTKRPPTSSYFVVQRHNWTHPAYPAYNCDYKPLAKWGEPLPGKPWLLSPSFSGTYVQPDVYNR